MAFDLSTATTDDFLRALDEHPAFLQAVRHKVFERELLELPHRLAGLTDRVDRLAESIRTFVEEQQDIKHRLDATIEELRQSNQELREFNQEQRQFNQEQQDINHRLDTTIEELRQSNRELRQFNQEQQDIKHRLDATIEELRESNRELRQFNQEQREFKQEQRDINHRLDTTIEELRESNRRLDTAVGDLKGENVERVIKRHFADIPDAMEYEYVDTVSRKELRQMVYAPDAARDMPHGERRSFCLADLVLKVQDEAGAVHYIAVEASYTADRRDTDRALRNAALLQRFTGCPSHAVVASLRNDRALDPLIAEDKVFWYRMTEEHLQEE